MRGGEPNTTSTSCAAGVGASQADQGDTDTMDAVNTGLDDINTSVAGEADISATADANVADVADDVHNHSVSTDMEYTVDTSNDGIVSKSTDDAIADCAGDPSIADGARPHSMPSADEDLASADGPGGISTHEVSLSSATVSGASVDSRSAHVDACVIATGTEDTSGAGPRDASTTVAGASSADDAEAESRDDAEGDMVDDAGKLTPS